MSSVHVHLLLAHVPVIGAFGVVFLLLLAFARRSSEIARAAFYVTIVIAFAAGAVFLTGEGAEEIAERLPGVAEAAIERHEHFAVVGLWSTIGLGVLGVGLLLAFRRREVPRVITGAALVLSLAAGGVLGYTANLGGQIRHTEVGSARAAPELPRPEDRDH